MNKSNIIIILLVILLALILIFIIYYFSKQFLKNKHQHNQKDNILSNKEKEYQLLIEQYQNKLANINDLNQHEIKKEIINQAKKTYQKEIDQAINELKKEANLKASNILVESMQNIVEPIIQENSISIFKLEDEQIKGRLIGKEGRNKKSFEMITGVELIIDKDSPTITISSHNPIRREIASLMLDKLIKSKNIDANKIESIYQEIKEQFEKDLFNLGKDVIENQLNIHDLNNDLYYYIGRMKYRSSFGQNTLNHMLECASVAKNIAFSLKLDEQLAMKCAFLHDLGKSMDYELNTNHVDVGTKLAKQLKLDPIIINAIASHHNNVVSNNIYSEITKIADTISASRPGARLNSTNEYFQRVNKLETIINEFKEVNQTYVLKAGRYLRVIVNPIMIKDQALSELAQKIKEKIENDELTKGYNIKVCLIKENKYEFETENKLI